jgi:signal transduction histidine kinase
MDTVSGVVTHSTRGYGARVRSRYGDVLAAALTVGIFWAPRTAAAAGWPQIAVGIGLAAIMAATLVMRRLLPVAAVGVVAVTTIVGAVLGVTADPMLATAWCLYPLAVTQAVRLRKLVVVLAGFLVALAAVTGVPAGGAGDRGQRLVLSVTALAGAWLLGTAVGRQAESAREAERARVQLEVAREVHDVVGHALGLISAEAAVTRSLPDAGDKELRESLGEVEARAREALEEMQALVRGLRAAPSSRPVAPGIAQLSRLIAAMRAAGVPVDARVDVGPAVDEAVGAVVYRIVQESLSNVVKHAPGAACSVVASADDTLVSVLVRDHGPGARENGLSGFGLRGMSERARSVSGKVSWGNHPGGGFEVSARLPVRTAR